MEEWGKKLVNVSGASTPQMVVEPENPHWPQGILSEPAVSHT